MAQQAIGEIVEVVQALADQRIGLTHHARACVVLHTLDGGFGGETRVHGFTQTLQPTAIVGEHAIGFENVTGLAGNDAVFGGEHGVDRGAQLGDGTVELQALFREVVGNQLLDADAGLVQHSPAHGDAFAERGAVTAERAVALQAFVDFGKVDELA